MRIPIYSPRLVFVLRTLLVLLFAVPLACATTGAGSRSHPVVGLVVAADGDQPLALDEQGTIRTLAGPRRLLDQLGRLPGAIVSVGGSVTNTRVVVRSFDIEDAGDGLRPLVGRIVVDQAGVQLEDDVTGTRLALRGEALGSVKHQHGSRVWVTGSVVGPQTFLIAHWGLLVPADH